MSMPSRDVRSVWRQEARRALLWLLAGAAIGFLLGMFFVFVLLAVCLYLGTHLYYAHQMHRWLVAGEEPGNGVGVWQEIFAELYRLKQRNRRRKHRLNRIVREFRASTAALPDGAVVLDRHGRILWFNQAAAALLALRSREDTGQRLVNLLRLPQVSRFLNRDGDDIAELEITSPNNDQITILLRLIPYGNQQRLLIARDISAQQHTDTMRRDFVANASHELRTPLTVLRGYLEMMSTAADTDTLATWRPPVDEMDGQARRMDAIIDDLLRLARLESASVEQRQTQVDMAALITHAVEAQQATAQGAHAYEFDMDHGLMLYGRMAEIDSVVTNLITNAAQYTQAGGGIHIRWQQDEQGASLSVTDEGIGIEADKIPRLTERFYRADPGRTTSTGGTGLGLAIVRHCLVHHDAQLLISSTPGAGSTFTCQFPKQLVVTAESA